MDNLNENYLEKSPIPTTIEGTKIILNQMESKICKIHKTNSEKGTGFFCKISYNNKIMLTLITNYHVVNENFIKNNKEMKITLNDDNVPKTIYLRNKIIYTNKDYDITIIQIKKEIINEFLEIDDKLFNEGSENLYSSIYILHYPKGDKASVSYGTINQIEGDNINHYCSTEKGSSGSPILNLLTNKIIGIHKKGTSYQFNQGTFLKKPIKDFINKYFKNNITKLDEYQDNSNNISLNLKNVINDNIKNNDNNSTKIYEFGKYIGELKKDKRNGEGITYYNNGDKLEGIWKNDKAKIGIMYYINEDNGRYEGEFKEGMRDGLGIYYYKDGAKYEGNWKKHNREGKGVIILKNGNRYEGDWKNDKMEGKGIIYYNNGNRDMGDFINGKPIGKHVILDTKGNITSQNY